MRVIVEIRAYSDKEEIPWWKGHPNPPRTFFRSPSRAQGHSPLTCLPGSVDVRGLHGVRVRDSALGTLLVHGVPVSLGGRESSMLKNEASSGQPGSFSGNKEEASGHERNRRKLGCTLLRPEEATCCSFQLPDVLEKAKLRRQETGQCCQGWKDREMTRQSRGALGPQRSSGRGTVRVTPGPTDVGAPSPAGTGPRASYGPWVMTTCPRRPICGKKKKKNHSRE